MTWFDSLLGVFILAIVPFILAAYGGHLSAQVLRSTLERRRAKLIFWGLCSVGIIIAGVYQFRLTQLDGERDLRAARADEDRQKKIDAAEQIALKAQSDLKAIEQSNGQQIRWLQRRVDEAMLAAQSQGKQNATEALRADLSAMAETIKQQGLLHPQTIPSMPSVMPAPIAQPTITQCRQDNLSGCSDEQFLEMGVPLLKSMSDIIDAHMVALGKLDDIKGGNWTSFLTGQDKDSKWLRAYADAQESAADKFRDCCAENSLRYHKELLQRLGGGLENIALYVWIDELLRPLKSKSWKEARNEGGGKVMEVRNNLQSLCFKLDAQIRMSKLK